MTRATLCGKKILVTAGPTWVAMDSVRVISNVSTGELGLALAKKAARMGADVDLFLGPVEKAHITTGVKVFRFKFFDELKSLIASRLKNKSYDIILHAAAVSDYSVRAHAGKISSDKKNLVIRLTRAPKLIHIMRYLNPGALLVMFKLEAGVADAALITRARRAMKKAKADLAVANCFNKGSYRGFVLDADKVSQGCATRERLTRCLLKAIQKKINL